MVPGVSDDAGTPGTIHRTGALLPKLLEEITTETTDYHGLPRITTDYRGLTRILRQKAEGSRKVEGVEE